MTEAKRTVEEVMGLVEKLEDAGYSSVRILARTRIESAIRALCEERDRAVAENALLMARQIALEGEAGLMLAMKAEAEREGKLREYTAQQLIYAMNGRDAAVNQCAELRKMVDQAVKEKDTIWRNYRELIADFLPYNECLPECDSFGCAEGCPVHDAQISMRKMKEERDALALRVKVLEGAVKVNAVQNADGIYYCVFCGCSQLDTDIRYEDFKHAPDCIVRTIQSTKETH